MSKARYAITAVIYDRQGRVLSVGQNSYTKTHPYQAKLAAQAGQPYKQCLHAEIDAIVKCKKLKQAHRIWISRWDSLGNPRNARPCEICASAITAAGISVVEHT